MTGCIVVLSVKVLVTGVVKGLVTLNDVPWILSVT